MGRTWGSWEIDDGVKLGVGTAAMILSFCLFLSPLKTFVKIVQEKTTSEFSSLPYQMTFFNCTLWILYTNYEGSLLSALITNCVGIVIEVIYLTIFVYFSSNRKRFAIQMLSGAVVVGVVMAVISVPKLNVAVTSEQNVPAFTLGLLATFFNILMYGAPLSVIATVIKTRSVEYMPFLLSFFTLINSSMWLTYGVYVGDIWVSTPNACGVILGIIQLVIYAVYSGADPYDELEAQGLKDRLMATEEDIHDAQRSSNSGATAARPLRQDFIGDTHGEDA